MLCAISGCLNIRLCQQRTHQKRIDFLGQKNCCWCINLSNLNCKPQIESRQQQLALYIDRNIRLVAIMIDVTSRHLECTDYNLDCSQMSAVALHRQNRMLTRKGTLCNILMENNFRTIVLESKIHRKLDKKRAKCILRTATFNLVPDNGYGKASIRSYSELLALAVLSRKAERSQLLKNVFKANNSAKITQTLNGKPRDCIPALYRSGVGSQPRVLQTEPHQNKYNLPNQIKSRISNFH